MRRLAIVLALAALLPRAAHAQRAITVRADNDAFNFWQLPWSRPDEEYTSGVRLNVAVDGTAFWARRFQPLLGACPGAESPCAAHAYGFGQDIYTAVRLRDVPTALPGGRPDAGVLWVSGSTRVERLATLTELSWTIGTTGKPSLAEPMQRFFHSLGPSWNRPITWGRQVPAEPVFAAAWDRRTLAALGALELQPHAGASIGTLLTEARAGVGMRMGAGLSHPWRPHVRERIASVAFVGDATVRGVARNEVLSGAFFRGGPSVPLRPVVTELEGGIRLRWRSVEAAWVAHQTSAEYTSRHSAHAWSTLEASWRPPRRSSP